MIAFLAGPASRSNPLIPQAPVLKGMAIGFANPGVDRTTGK
jgi:hypothetical protein